MPKAHTEISQKLCEYLASKGAELWVAKFISSRFARIFGERAYDIIGAFEQSGWTYDDIFWLDSKSRAWRKQPAQVFKLQLALQGAECPLELAKRLVMEPHVFEIQDIERIAACMRAMKELGLHEPQIRFATLRKPRILALAPEDLREWYDRFQAEGKDPILFLHTLDLLIRKTAEELGRDKPAKQKDDGALIVATPKKPEVRLPTPVPSVDLQAKLDAEPKPAPKPVPEPTPVLEQPKPAPVVQKAVLPTPAFAITAGPKPVPRLVKPKAPVPVIMPKPEPEIQREYKPDERNEENWEVLANQILLAVEPRWNDRKWQKWLKANPWVKDFCQQTKNLDQILHWVRITSNFVPRDSRSKLIARVLLNRDNLGSILEIPEMALYLRFYAIRRALDQEPMRKPKLLCLPFEQVQAMTAGPIRSLTIPPPAMPNEDDMEAGRKMMQAKFEEIRFRANAIRGKGKNPLNKPYINMILEPTQERFIARLRRYLEKPIPEKELNASFRRPREFATPRSRLL